MSTTLSKGYKLPQNGDYGTTWFPDLAYNIQRLNDHSHDGVDSNKLSSVNLTASITSAAVGSFVDQGDGYWRATVSSPGAVAIANLTFKLRDPTTLETIAGRIEKNTASSVYVYLNVPQTVDVVFSA